MKYFLFIFFILILPERIFSQDTCKLTNVFPDKALNENESRLSFFFQNPIGTPMKGAITILLNSDSLSIVADSNGKANLVVPSAKYSFGFNSEYMKPIEMDSVELKSQHDYHLNIHFDGQEFVLPNIIFEYDKPVIYFYPEATTQIEVKLEFNGELGFCYPKYENGWNFSATPNGDLIFDNKNYNYLFWEGKTEIQFKQEIFQNGFIVSSDTLLKFLESSLEQIGLSSSEIQDFVTYWIPRMTKNKENFIHFLTGENYNEYAELNILPKPDNFIRVFMVWSSIEDFPEQTISIQKLPSFSRSGFHVVEWGGSEIKRIVK